MKVEGRGQACPSNIGLGEHSRTFPGGPPFTTSLISLAAEWFQGSSAETEGGGREHSVPLSLPLSSPLSLSPSALRSCSCRSRHGPRRVHTASHFWVPLACSRPQKPQTTMPLWSREMFGILILFRKCLGCRRLAQLSWTSLCFIVRQPSPAAGLQGQRVTCSEPAAPA